MARIVANYSAFWERNDSRVILSSSTNAVSFSSTRTTKRFPSSRCASATKIVRPCASTVATQRQLQPALLSLSARQEERPRRCSPRQSCPYAREENTARTKLRHNLIGTIGCSGSDKTVQNLTDCADRNRAGQTLRKDFTGSRAFVCAGISLVNSPIEKREGVYWYERDRETTNNGADRA
jgi:hypothetical protein